MSGKILDLDLGNTRLKWRLSLGGGDYREGAVANSAGGLERLALEGKPDRVRIASVVNAEHRAEVVRFCRTRWQVRAEVASVQESCAGVQQGYADSSRLGVDRWLAFVAAFQLAPGGCVVVSCGTAVTVDLVTATGQHLGGYIVPGLQTMRTALFAGTSAVKLDKLVAPESLAPGTDTSSAVSRGLVLMIRGLVDSAIAELAGQAGTPHVWVSGGDGELIKPYLNPPFTSTNAGYRPNLVLDGLAIALP